MKQIKLQIKNLKNIPTKEQQVINADNFFAHLFEAIGIYDGEVIVQVKPRAHIEDGGREFELRLSRITGNPEWHELTGAEELYGDFAPREKELLYILSAYEMEEVKTITGLKESSVRKILRCIYGKIDPEGKKKKHSAKDLWEFCLELEKAGVELIVWNEKMEKERKQRKSGKK